MSRFVVGVVTLVAMILGACGGGPGGGPPEILYGEDICDRCRMVISEERHAAAARLEGREYRFDDPGCLRSFLAEEQRAEPPGAWVHDPAGSWLPVDKAWLVVDPEGGTPMGSGILAFESRQAAASAARRYQSEPQRWEGLGVGSESTFD